MNARSTYRPTHGTTRRIRIDWREVLMTVAVVALAIAFVVVGLNIWEVR